MDLFMGDLAVAPLTVDVKIEDGADDGEKKDEKKDSSSTLAQESMVDKFFHQKMIHSSIQNDGLINAIHNQAEQFSPRVEFAFGYVQVVTACFASFAHGSNDVGTLVGPLAGIYTAYTQGVGGIQAGKKAPVEDWILALGGAGLIVGLALYGHTIIAAMGVKLIRITPSRGFCIELAAATITVIGTFLAIPLSSSQGFVGALVGVSLMEGKRSTTNWRLLGLNVLSWIATLIFCGCISAAIFSFGTFAPSQIYPLSKRNCMAYYATTLNVSNGDPSTFLIGSVDGAVRILYGYPTTGEVFSVQ